MSIEITREGQERLESIAEAAGREILRWYGARDAEVSHKADGTPLTSADRAANDLILAALEAWDGSIPVVSEEGGSGAGEPASMERFWLVDPLDGTKEFLTGNGEFTVNIALIDRGDPVLGVVSAPAPGLIWSAGRGLGAWRRGPDGARERVYSAPPVPGRPLVVAESRSHPSPDLEGFLAALPVSRRVRAGSSIKLCWVADGTADIYPRLGPTMEWDVAAGDCVFRWSGRDAPRRSPLRYGKPGFRNGPFVLGLDPDDPIAMRTARVS